MARNVRLIIEQSPDNRRSPETGNLSYEKGQSPSVITPSGDKCVDRDDRGPESPGAPGCCRPQGTSRHHGRRTQLSRGVLGKTAFLGGLPHTRGTPAIRQMQPPTSWCRNLTSVFLFIFRRMQAPVHAPVSEVPTSPGQVVPTSPSG